MAGSAAGYFWSGVVKDDGIPCGKVSGRVKGTISHVVFSLFFIAIEVSMEVNFTFVILFTSMEANLLPKK